MVYNICEYIHMRYVVGVHDMQMTYPSLRGGKEGSREGGRDGVFTVFGNLYFLNM